MALDPAVIQADIDRVRNIRRRGIPHFWVDEDYFTRVMIEVPWQRPDRWWKYPYGRLDFYLETMRVLEHVGFWWGWDKFFYRGRNRNCPQGRGYRPTNHVGACGRLRFKSSYSGGKIEIEFYQDHDPVWHPHRPGDHSYGSRYEMDKRARMDTWTRYRFLHAVAKLRSFLTGAGLADASNPTYSDPRDDVEYRVRESCHFTGEASIDVPRKNIPSYNSKDGSGRGTHLENGQTKCFYNYEGRLLQGRVYHNINSMWWVIAGGKVYNLGSHDLFSYTPTTPLRDPRRSKRRVTELIAAATKEENYERAIILRNQRRDLETRCGGARWPS